ncbi:MAG TPA: PLD nuclease N-terminal domain-containing protein [Candidatus Subteraquimicrobiales bacterium]
MIVALIDLFKREKVTGGNKIIWGLVIVLINFIGPILYLVIGRKED